MALYKFRIIIIIIKGEEGEWIFNDKTDG